MVAAGSTQNFTVSYDSSLSNGLALAQTVLDYCEYDFTRISMLFNVALPAASLPLIVNIVPGSGGAYNNGVNTITCTLPATFQGSISGLVAAEEAEIFMNAQGKGWIPYWSNGEALSRVTPQILHPDASWLFSTGAAWLNSTNPSRPDWVDKVEPTDKDLVSIGCGSLFLNYLAYQLGFEWPSIIAAGAPTTNTLGETASILGVANAYQNFYSLLAGYYPVGSPAHIQTDDVFPLGALPAQLPILYIRHNLADNGTSHAPPLSSSPDIIPMNSPVANPQATFSTAASIASDTQGDPSIVDGRANYVYLRVWNRGVVDAPNAFATVYWSPPATLVTPNLWNLIGSAYFPSVPSGSVVQVSNPGILWPSDKIPNPGHYCFVAMVGNADEPAPGQSPPSETGTPLSNFATFSDYENYIAANNNIAWRNFNVVIVPFPLQPPGRFGPFVGLPFLISGAWDQALPFTLETSSDLPTEGRVALQVAEWVAGGLRPSPSHAERYRDAATDPKNSRRVRFSLPINVPHTIGEIHLPAGTAAPSHLLVQIPRGEHDRRNEIVIRQLYKDREVGRITWKFVFQNQE